MIFFVAFATLFRSALKECMYVALSSTTSLTFATKVAFDRDDRNECNLGKEPNEVVLSPGDSREANEWFVTRLEAFCVALATFDEIVVNNSLNDCMYVALLSDV